LAIASTSPQPSKIRNVHALTFEKSIQLVDQPLRGVTKKQSQKGLGS
jgi:hypothetical protein